MHFAFVVRNFGMMGGLYGELL